ncbi:trk system potassium uptake protein TrkH [Desulfovibrio desulfuricans]|uniref:Trk system potassium uptake protein TrkH n=2 Tax=Desulfovibrionaceae TaxID=194924 RepID=A0AA94L2A8_DESDE|nr:trk system potassium uptake protein TrkH [Desulfovibrio desulfuricans]SPD34610.1 Cation transporter [Desulfovibrio sp. G11]
MGGMQRNRFFSPLTWPVFSFLVVIAVGAVLLHMPASLQEGQSLSPIDAAFIATSAVCVTGLTPVDISAVLSPAGVMVLLFLVQLGGLGVMTYTSIIFLLWRNHVPFTSREAVSQALLGDDFNLKGFLLQVLALVFSIELVTGLLLYWHDPVFFHPISAAFHAVSAFCNAGFSLSPNSLMNFRDDVTVNCIITASVFLGSIGFGVLREALGIISGGRMGIPVRSFSRFSRLVLKTTVFLIVVGAALGFVIEFWRVGNEQALGDGFDLALTAFFQAAVARTAGFNTVNMSSLSEATLLVLMALMFVGGGPGSCAGGIKVVTFRVLVGYIAAQFRGDRQIVLEGRGVPAENVSRALTLFFFYSMLVGFSTFLLSITEYGILHGTGVEGPSFLRILFEEVSALGTVGLSMNLTPELSAEGKGVIIVNMFAGRVGLLSLLMAVQSLQPRKAYTVAETQLPIG